MSHNSTALVLVALEKKPVLLVTTAAAYPDLSSLRAIKLVAAAFGKAPIDVDKLPHSIDWQRELFVNEKFYSRYVQQYVKKADSEQLNSWQIFANRLKQS